MKHLIRELPPYGRQNSSKNQRILWGESTKRSGGSRKDYNISDHNSKMSFAMDLLQGLYDPKCFDSNVVGLIDFLDHQDEVAKILGYYDFGTIFIRNKLSKKLLTRIAMIDRLLVRAKTKAKWAIWFSNIHKHVKWLESQKLELVCYLELVKRQ